jgi:AcrR family transcriptional regulator
MAARKRSPGKRPARGAPQETRARLVETAARVFNQVGFHGTDSNRIASAAGYAAGTFYKHFTDKHEIFLAAWEAWVGAEWAAVDAALAEGGSPRERAARIVELVLDWHRRWRGFRASMHALLATDAAARRVHRAQRRRQLRMLHALREHAGQPPHATEDDALLLLTLERVCDAIAQGEARSLGLSERALAARLGELVERHLR